MLLNGDDNGMNGEVTRIVLDGDVDISTADRIRSIVEAECRRGSSRVVIDLSAVEFVDSHGLHLFAETHRKLMRDERVLVLVPPPDVVWRPFVITGLDGVFMVDPDA
jgi:anti-sigma B factor antagonist